MALSLPPRLVHLISHPSEFPNQSLFVACETQQQAHELLGRLYENSGDDVFHTEIYPCTSDEGRHVEYYALLIRRLHYDRDLGWFSANIRSTPDFDLRAVDDAQTNLGVVGTT